ncbi:MAG TPA: hypothetical protein VJ785_14420 [Anaerolineales bacterium]|nr:hypothetical protein [Anaerolineales bacterium]
MFTKNSRNKYDKKDSLELGQKAENLFAKSAIKHGWKIKPAPRRSNIDEHFDYIMSKDGKSHKVEVKSRKRRGRKDQDVQDEYIWVEIHGVRKDDQGWLYGEADLIAFEMAKSFRIVRRADLAKLIGKLVDFGSMTHKPGDALYKLYSRRDRHDLLTMIRSDDLLQITTLDWSK